MKIKILLTALMAWSLAAQAAPQKIEFWTFSMKPKFTPYFETLVHNYEAANPGVKIEWIDFPWDVIQTKLVTRIVAGTPPALVNLNVPWADEFARDGLLTPVDALLADARPRYLASTLEDLTFGGHTYGFPMYSNVAVITYNKEMFKAAGLTHAPRSMDEELDYARRIAASTGQAGLCPALSKIDGLFMQQGLAVIAHGKAVFNSPQHVAFIQKLADTYRAGGLLKDSLFAEDNFPAAIAAYKGGRLGMLLAPPTAVPRIESDAKDIYAVTDVAPAPLGPSGIADGGWLVHFAVPRGVDSKLLPAIGKFARYLTDDDNQLIFAKQAVLPIGTIQYARRLIHVQVGADAAEAVAALVLQGGAGAHRQAAEVHVMQVQCIEQIVQVVSVLVEDAALLQRQPVRTAEAAQVRNNEAHPVRQRRHEGHPHRGAHGEAVKEDTSLGAAPETQVVQPCAIAHWSVGHGPQLYR